MVGHDLTSDRQAETGALTVRFCGVEGVEETIARFRIETHAVVFDDDVQHGVLPLDRYPNVPVARCCGIDGIGKNVDDRLGQARRILRYRRIVLDADFDINLPLAGARLDQSKRHS